MEIKIAPSILAADMTRLGDEVKKVETAGADWLHIDIMDGHFVPNLSFSPQIVRALRPMSQMYFDVHLMLAEPEKYIDAFAEAGADLITIHAEAAIDQQQMLAMAAQIHSHGIQAGISLKPGTPAEILQGILADFELILVMSVEPGFGGQAYIQSVNEKIQCLRQMAKKDNPNMDIEVDGGITAENIQDPVKYGANILVAGSSVFGAKDPAAAIVQLRENAQRAVNGA